MDKTWKKAERRAAAFFGVNRNPLSGIGSRHTGADTIDEDFFVEVKYRQKQAALSLLDDTAEQSRKETGIRKAKVKVPVVALFAARRQGFGILIDSDDLAQFCFRYLRRIGYTVRL